MLTPLTQNSLTLSLLQGATRNPIKAGIYISDDDFLRGCAAFLAAHFTQEATESFLRDHCLVVLKPEAFLYNNGGTFCDALTASQFLPVAVRKLKVSISQSRKIWIYQSRAMTPAHLDLVEDLMSAGHSVLVLLRDLAERVHTPATSRITYLKGPTQISKRRRSHLRSLLGPGIADVLSYFHASDDPADLMRDLAILLPNEDLKKFLAMSRMGRDLSRVLRRFMQKEHKKHQDNKGEAPTSMRPLHLSPPDWPQLIARSKAISSNQNGRPYREDEVDVPDLKKYLASIDGHLIDVGLYGPGF